MPANGLFESVPAGVWTVIGLVAVAFIGWRQKVAENKSNEKIKAQESSLKAQEQKLNEAKEDYQRGQSRITFCEDRMDDLEKKIEDRDKAIQERDKEYDRLHKEHLEECKLRANAEIALSQSERDKETQKAEYEKRIQAMQTENDQRMQDFQKQLAEAASTITSLNSKLEELRSIITNQQVANMNGGSH